MYVCIYIYMYIYICIYITRIRLLCPLWMVRSCFGDVWKVLAWFLRHPCHKIPGSYMVMWKKPGCRKPNTRKLGLADAPLSRLKGNPLMSQRSKRVRISIIFTFPVYPLVNIHSYWKLPCRVDLPSYKMAIFHTFPGWCSIHFWVCLEASRSMGSPGAPKSIHG